MLYKYGPSDSASSLDGYVNSLEYLSTLCFILEVDEPDNKEKGARVCQSPNTMVASCCGPKSNPPRLALIKHIDMIAPFLSISTT